MNNILDVEINKSETPEDRAKITGLICIGCAIIAIFFAILGSANTFILAWLLPFYFVFVLLSAASGLIGYSEIKAIGSGWVGSVFLLLSITLLVVSFLSVSLKQNNFRFGVIYGIFATLIPLMLTVLVLITNKTALWKAFIPLSIPVLHLLAYPLANSIGFPLGAAMLSLGWGLLGMVAYQGRE